MQQHLTRAVLLAGLMAAGMASAQSGPAQPVPPNAGEGSSVAPQRPDGGVPASREAVKAEARAQNRNAGNSNTPYGEASTQTNGEPNVTPQAMSGVTRAEVRQSALKTKPHFQHGRAVPSPKDSTSLQN
jgi:ribosomal protein L4